MYKRRIVLGVFALVSALISFAIWRTMRNSLSTLDSGDMYLLGFATIVGIALLIVSVLIFSRREFLLIPVAFLAPFLFVVGWGWQYLVVAVLVFLLFVAGASSMQYASKNRLKVGFYPFIMFGAPTMLTAIAVLFACVGYFYPFEADKISLSPALFSTVSPIAESAIASRVPYYKKGMTLDEFIESSVTSSLKDAGVASLSAEMRALVRAKIAEQKAGFEEQLGMKLSGSERFDEMLAGAANSYLNRYLVSYKDFLPIMVAVLVFLTVKSLGFIINRLSVGCAWLFTRALMASGVVRMDKVMVEKETLVLAE